MLLRPQSQPLAKSRGNGAFTAVTNNSFLRPRGLAAVHLTNPSWREHNLVLDCEIYTMPFLQSIRVCQPFWEAVKTPSTIQLINIQALTNDLRVRIYFTFSYPAPLSWAELALISFPPAPGRPAACPD